MNKVTLNIKNYKAIISNLENKIKFIGLITDLSSPVNEYGNTNVYRLQFFEDEGRYTYWKHDSKHIKLGTFFDIEYFQQKDLVQMLDDDYDF
jgi:hypothetical protein